MKKILFVILILILVGTAWLSYSQNRQIKNLESKITELQKTEAQSKTEKNEEFDIYETENYSFTIPKGYVVASRYNAVKYKLMNHELSNSGAW